MIRFISFQLLLSMAILTFSVQTANADDSSDEYSVTAYIESNDEYTDKVEEERPWNRAPSRPIKITISLSEGVFIPGVDESDVISYEAYSENGVCLISTVDGADFASQILSLNGFVQIRIRLTDYTLYGWLQQ